MIGAANMGAPGFFVFFGFIFIAIAIIQAVFHFKNATGENRMSIYDITEHEPDPLERHFNSNPQQEKEVDYNNVRPKGTSSVNFCPNCGENVAHASYNYCPVCGQQFS